MKTISGSWAVGRNQSSGFYDIALPAGVARVVLTITDTVPPGYSTSEALRPHIVLREVLQVLNSELAWYLCYADTAARPALVLLTYYDFL